MMHWCIEIPAKEKINCISFTSLTGVTIAFQLCALFSAALLSCLVECKVWHARHWIVSALSQPPHAVLHCAKSASLLIHTSWPDAWILLGFVWGMQVLGHHSHIAGWLKMLAYFFGSVLVILSQYSTFSWRIARCLSAPCLLVFAMLFFIWQKPK